LLSKATLYLYILKSNGLAIFVRVVNAKVCKFTLGVLYSLVIVDGYDAFG